MLDIWMYDFFLSLWQQVQRFVPRYNVLACLCCVLTFICISLIVLLLCVVVSGCRIIGRLQEQLTEKKNSLYILKYEIHNLERQCNTMQQHQHNI